MPTRLLRRSRVKPNRRPWVSASKLVSLDPYRSRAPGLYGRAVCASVLPVRRNHTKSLARPPCKAGTSKRFFVPERCEHRSFFGRNGTSKTSTNHFGTETCRPGTGPCRFGTVAGTSERRPARLQTGPGSTPDRVTPGVCLTGTYRFSRKRAPENGH